MTILLLSPEASHPPGAASHSKIPLIERVLSGENNFAITE